MIRRVIRASALLVAGPFLLFAFSLAPQHVHTGGPDHDHAVAHSHFGPHAANRHDADTTEIEHDEEQVVWLDSPMLHQAGFQIAPLAALTAVSAVAPVRPRWAVVERDTAAPAHGPPRHSTRFRGPPSLLV